MLCVEHQLCPKYGLTLCCWTRIKLTCKSFKVTDIAGFGLIVFDWIIKITEAFCYHTDAIFSCPLQQALPRSLGLRQSWQLGTCPWWCRALQHLCSHSRPFIQSWFLPRPVCIQANTCKLVIPLWFLISLEEESWLYPFGFSGYTSKRTRSFAYPVNSPTSCWSLSVFLLGGLATFAISHTRCGLRFNFSGEFMGGVDMKIERRSKRFFDCLGGNTFYLFFCVCRAVCTVKHCKWVR